MSRNSSENLFKDFLADPQDKSWKPFLLKWLGIALAFHLLAAVFSIGHHSADEYFQVLEFVSYKLGRTPVQHLPDEFREAMRPWLLPAALTFLSRALSALGMTNPHWQAMVFRLCAGTVGWLSLALLSLLTRVWFKDAVTRRWVVVAGALWWCLPVLQVRPSSESLSGSFFLIGLALAVIAGRTRPRVFFAAGVALGLSFEFRFQMAFAILGLSAWLIWMREPEQRKGRWRNFAFLASGAGIIFLLGRWVDVWGYDQAKGLVFTPWRYFEYNILRGQVNQFNRSPWWEPLRMTVMESWPLLGTAQLLITLLAWWRAPKHPLTWAHLPFTLVHLLIPHKELRFFFPVAFAGPIYAGLALGPIGHWKSIFEKRRSLTALRRLYNLNALLALVMLCLLPFSRVVQFWEGTYSLLSEKNGRQTEVWYATQNPFEVLGNPCFFYRPQGLVIRRISDAGGPTKVLETYGGPREFWFFHNGSHFDSDVPEFRGHCELVYRTIPLWAEKHINFGNWVARTHVWNLFRCR